ncbi:S1C family serine protease [Undibacter mobilis]|uniref:Serine protease n=1 Tax=Undibacter mobilis TaxID=2292256 RepID=A0A371B8P8_9BRAD|nr:S1C family serine protease [Undibacter mobilis]RDV03912.1 serine protease [Undibacter mobilis]
MASLMEFKVPPGVQPRPEDYAFDLDRALASIVGLHAIIPNDAFTATTLGVERAGNGVLIGDGLVLTVGYLITEAETIWLHLSDGRIMEGHPLGVDQETGFGLVQTLGRPNLPALELGSSAEVDLGDRVVIGAAGGRKQSLAARVAARQEFAGYWEYLLDDAIFTFPSHPHWGGTGLISARGDLVGIGSLQIERATGGESGGQGEHLNMMIPIDLLKPVLDDLSKYGRVSRPVRPWLGIFTTEIEDQLVVVGVADKGPASRVEIKTGDMIVAVAGQKVTTLAELYRAIWALGVAGVEVPLTLHRDGVTFDVRVNSSDRNKFLKGPKVH